MSKSGEYDERLATMLSNMQSHIEADAVAFKALQEGLIEINKDVKSIIASRNFAAGVWKALTIAAGIVTFLVTIYVMYKGGH